MSEDLSLISDFVHAQRDRDDTHIIQIPLAGFRKIDDPTSTQVDSQKRPLPNTTKVLRRHDPIFNHGISGDVWRVPTEYIPFPIMKLAPQLPEEEIKIYKEFRIYKVLGHLDGIVKIHEDRVVDNERNTIGYMMESCVPISDDSLSPSWMEESPLWGELESILHGMHNNPICPLAHGRLDASHIMKTVSGRRTVIIGWSCATPQSEDLARQNLWFTTPHLNHRRAFEFEAKKAKDLEDLKHMKENLLVDRILDYRPGQQNTQAGPVHQ